MRYLDVDTDRRISRIGLGTWQFGAREWGYGSDYAQAQAGQIVRRALELGVTLFDTAEAYGFGRSERILGAALQAAAAEPASVMVATKITPVLPVAPVVQQRALASAARLGVRRIDLYQVHAPNPVVRDATTMRGMRALQQVGLVGEVGVSNYPVDRWQAADAALGSRVLTNQVRYNLVDRRAERDLLPYADRAGRVILAYSPLAQGLLAGRYDRDHRPRDGVRAMNPLFLPENLERVAPLLETVREVAAGRGATPAQVALAWTIRTPAVAAIPGAASVEQLEHNVAAAEIELTDDEYAALSAAADRFEPVRGITAVRRMAVDRVRPVAARVRR